MMENFCFKLIGIAFGVSAALPETKAYCKEFWSEDEPEIKITLTEQDRVRAREALIRVDLYEGHPRENYPDMLLENIALHLRVLDELIKRDAVMFHGCAVAVGGKVYLFCADSGTGKTTHAKLWLKNIPDCHILNGDKPILIFRDGAVQVCGTPWRGKEGFGTNEILPLAGLCLLERDRENHIEPVSFQESFEELLRHTYCPLNTWDLCRYMRLMQKLVPVPIYRLRCNMEDEAALVSYRGMVK